MNGKRVAIFGGVAGMSAAHELAERGFVVTVYEARTIPGGKARSMPVPNSGSEGRKDLPGEHGFRFFPGFYKHVPDIMRRIPYDTNRNGVLDNLQPSTRFQISHLQKPTITLSAQMPRTIDESACVHQSLWYRLGHYPPKGTTSVSTTASKPKSNSFTATTGVPLG